ncbi:MAG: DUF4019 domain-containing protein [Caulobacter sp.]|nr:DUF4019 domain-containing protein [Caulobacter sp.]
MEDPPRRSFITGEIDVKALIAFVFGAIFIITILAFATLVKDPSSTAIWTYRVILALAAGGVAAILPGFIDVKYKSFVQAGGAIGVFVLVLMAFPTPSPAPNKADAPASASVKTDAAPAEEVIWPTDDPEFMARKYIDLIDADRLVEAFETVDTAMGFKWSSFETTYKSGRIPLGAVVDRRQTESRRAVDPQGKPKGAYAFVAYQTKYANDKQCWDELVTLKVSPTKTWRVAGHAFTPAKTECIGF